MAHGIYKPFLFVLVLLSAAAAVAQEPIQLTKTASDCLGALTLNDTIVGPVYSPEGYGNKLEISGYELGDPYFIQREHNTVWYRFTVPYDAIFSFDLIPNHKDDDFDFLLFHYDGPNFCHQVAAGTKIPVRTNISRKNVDVEGKTGLRASATDDYVPSGPGSSYSRSLKVDKGQVYYLLVDNPFRENQGHTIHLHFDRREISVNPEKPETDFAYKLPMRKLRITVTDAETGARLASNIFVNPLPDSVQSRFPAVSQITLEVLSYRTYTIDAIKKGYLPASETFTPKNDAVYEVAIAMKHLALGDRINLENIKFDSDQTSVLARSQSAVDRLVEFLNENPNLHIALQGHVNGESKRNKRKYRKLSTARAEAIYHKLVDAGIAPTRMSYEGFGNARMIYPSPVNERQAQANRRVEAEITKL